MRPKGSPHKSREGIGAENALQQRGPAAPTRFEPGSTGSSTSGSASCEAVAFRTSSERSSFRRSTLGNSGPVSDAHNCRRQSAKWLRLLMVRIFCPASTGCNEAALQVIPAPSAFPLPDSSHCVRSGTNLPGAAQEVFVGRQFLEAHGAAGVEFVGGDADLRAEAEFAAIGEARAGIPIDRRAVHLGEEALGGRLVRGDDAVAVMRAVALRCERSLPRANPRLSLRGSDRETPCGSPPGSRGDDSESLRSRRSDAQAQCAFVAAQLHAFREQGRAGAGEEFFRNVASARAPSRSRCRRRGAAPSH